MNRWVMRCVRVAQAVARPVSSHLLNLRTSLVTPHTACRQSLVSKTTSLELSATRSKISSQTEQIHPIVVKNAFSVLLLAGLA